MWQFIIKMFWIKLQYSQTGMEIRKCSIDKLITHKLNFSKNNAPVIIPTWKHWTLII